MKSLSLFVLLSLLFFSISSFAKVESVKMVLKGVETTFENFDTDQELVIVDTDGHFYRSKFVNNDLKLPQHILLFGIHFVFVSNEMRILADQQQFFVYPFYVAKHLFKDGGHTVFLKAKSKKQMKRNYWDDEARNNGRICAQTMFFTEKEESWFSYEVMPRIDNAAWAFSLPIKAVFGIFGNIMQRFQFVP